MQEPDPRHPRLRNGSVQENRVRPAASRKASIRVRSSVKWTALTGVTRGWSGSSVKKPDTRGQVGEDRELVGRRAVVASAVRAFVDPDGDALSFTASSLVPQVVTGAFVMLATASEGAATIRVMATDPPGKHSHFSSPALRG